MLPVLLDSRVLCSVVSPLDLPNYCRKLFAFVGCKGLRLPVEKEFGFSTEEAVQALEYLQSGAHVGKVCIKAVEQMECAF